MSKSLMQLTAEFGTGFWNDSCEPNELRDALAHGAIGATSNPVIVATVAKSASEIWNPVIDQFIRSRATGTEDDVGWDLTAEVVRKAAALLMPVYERSGGRDGRQSLQVNPKNFRNVDAMVAQAEELFRTAPNVAVKLPVVAAGLGAIEEATARGIVVTPTVCFSVSQAVAAGEAIERGLERAKKSGKQIQSMRPNVAVMVGRLDDHLKRVMEAQKISVDPGCLEWGGVAVFKRSYQIFQQRGFRSVLLAAAYRNHMQWSEMIGGKVNLTIPYSWWKRFNNSKIEVRPRMEEPVRADIIAMLEDNFPDFRRAYDPQGLAPDEFASFGPTAHTLKQFIGGYNELLALIRERMLR